MRVGIDGRAFHAPALGVRRYTWELCRAIAELASDIEMIAVGGRPTEPVPDGVPRIAELPSPPTNFGRHAMGLPSTIARARLDVFHAPAYTAPCWGHVPVVLSVHDVSYARHPEWYPYRRDALRRAFYAWSIRRARLILTDSEFSHGEIMAAYGIDERRIRVVPLGVRPAFSAAIVDHMVWRRTVQQHPYIIHVGDLHERRNLITLIRALGELRQRRPSQPAVRLLCAGTDRGLGPRLKQEATRQRMEDLLEIMGAVPEERLLALYRGASMLAYPSRYEGFGFPVLEAMACGVPVVAARAGALPEVVGEAAILIDPDSPSELADAIDAILSNPATAIALRAAGLERAAQFTWRRTAEATIAAYRDAVLDSRIDRTLPSRRE